MATTSIQPIQTAVSQDYIAGMERLVSVVRELSLANDLETVTSIVRTAARDLAGADGATFVLKENDLCFYVDEDAIQPLWKGRKFPMETCISGWVMINKQSTFIEDIYSDVRVPIDAYRPTFVRCLAMFPIRKEAPIGAIGLYWAKKTHLGEEETKLIQALADATSATMEKIRVYSELEKRVKERTAELEAANKEMEAFSYAASHDLRAPLRSLRGFAEALLDDYSEQLDETGKNYLNRIYNSATHMTQLMEDLLALSQTSRAPLNLTKVDLAEIARGISAELRLTAPERKVTFKIPERLVVTADERLMQAAMENLFSNAWKFTSHREEAVIELGVQQGEQGEVYFIRDNGAGFDMKQADKLFIPFHRLHSRTEFPGTGVGLTTVQRIIHKHEGAIWCEAEEGRGATFFFRLGTAQKSGI